MSWNLFTEGRRRPPRTARRALVWAVVVFIACAALLPFLVAGVIEAARQERLSDALVFGLVALIALFGAVAAVVAAVRARGRR